MEVYHYHSVTKEFITARAARKNPKREEYLLPADATFSEPPPAAEGFVRVWGGEVWSLVEDHRGKIAYSKADGRAESVEALGPLDNGLTFEAPNEFETWQEDGWYIDTVQQKIGLLSYLDQYRWEVEQGGISIGGNIIPTRDRDKVLINGKVTGAMLKNSADEETFTFTLSGAEILMTIAEIKAIGLAISEHVQATIDTAAALRPLIEGGELDSREDIRAAFDLQLASI